MNVTDEHLEAELRWRAMIYWTDRRRRHSKEAIYLREYWHKYISLFERQKEPVPWRPQ